MSGNGLSGLTRGALGAWAGTIGEAPDRTLTLHKSARLAQARSSRVEMDLTWLRPARNAAAISCCRTGPGPVLLGTYLTAIMPSCCGSHSVSGGQYVISTRNTSIVSSHGQTATVISLRPSLLMPLAT